jgi:nucleoid-associated protein YgaU
VILPTRESRLLRVPIVRDHEGRELFDIRPPLRYRPVEGMTRVTLRSSDSMHSIAYEFYGTPMLWWAIADFNGIFDVTSELVPGREIVVPPPELIEAYLSRPV